MNKDRRRIAQKLLDKLQPLLEDAIALREAEEEAFNNIPESLQGGDKAAKVQDVILNLETAENSIQEAVDALVSILEE